MDLSQVSKTELQEKLSRAMTRARSIAQKGQRAMQVTTTTGFTVLGGATAGTLMVKMPKLPGTQVDSHLVLGALLVGVGVSDVMGQWSDETAALGAGMLAADVAQRVARALQ